MKRKQGKKTKYSTPCGCKMLGADSAGRWQLMDIEYCPLHGAAEELSEALKAMTRFVERAYGGCASMEEWQMAIAALAKAQGERCKR